MRLYYNVGYQRGLPDPDVLDGVVVHTAAVDVARSSEELLAAGDVLMDPNVYLWGLDCEDAARTCAYMATYPWTPLEVPSLASFDGKRREWITAGVLPAIDGAWPPAIPVDIGEMVHDCLAWQYGEGATTLIAPAPLISQVHEGLSEYSRWLDAAAAEAKSFDRPVLMTVAFTEVCFPAALEGLLDLLTANRGVDGFYLVMETAHTSPYVASGGLADAMLELSYHLGERQGREVIINYADTFSLACLAAGATGMVAGYGMKYRRFSLSDYSDGGGGPYPRFLSLRTFCRYLASADMERIRDEDLLSEFDSDATTIGGPLLQALAAGGTANDVLGWEQERNRTASAKAHYVQRLRNAIDELSGLGDLESKIGFVRNQLVRADSMNSLLRETFDGESLDEDGTHVRVWRQALSRFRERYVDA